MNIHQDLTADLQAAIHAAAQRIAEARHWPEFLASAYAGFELATRTTRALVDASDFEEHVRLAEAERAATDGRDILRCAPGRMNVSGPLGAPITLPTDRVQATETSLSLLADAVYDRFAMAADEPLNADELVAFSEAMDAADRLQHALAPTGSPAGSTAGQGSAREVDDDDLP